MKSLKEYTNNLINERREFINKKTTSAELNFIKETENDIKKEIVGHSYCFLTEKFNEYLKRNVFTLMLNKKDFKEIKGKPYYEFIKDLVKDID